MSPDDQKLRAARAYARWHLGDPDWADRIIHAYEHPQETHERLREERDNDS